MKWFYNMRISAKLLTSFMIVALIAGVVGITGILNISTINKADTEMYEKNTVPLEQITSIKKAYDQTRITARDMVLDKNSANIDNNMNTINTSIETMKSELNVFTTTLLTPEGQKLSQDLKNAMGVYESYMNELFGLFSSGKNDDAYALMQTKGVEIAKTLNTPIDTLITLKVDLAKKKAESNTATANSATMLMIIFIAAGMSLAIVLGIFISRIISKPLNELVQVAGKISNGDLDVNVEVKSKDEIGILAKAFDAMSNNINDVMSNINSASEQVASGSRQVSDSSMALSQGATEQASSIEELTASLEEISSQTKLNAQNANQANELAETAKLNAVQGNTQMKEMLKAMEEINDSSANISKIIKVIDEIAFQTNILALNAAVEAARAGQHGKGFAVVAEEVRNLAARSANAAKEKTDMIEGSIKKVEGGTKIANETAQALNKIVEGVAKAAALVGDIAVASNEQASGIAQINQGIMQVSQVVQTNSATSEESAAASEELSSQAELLRESVNKFKLKKNNQAYGHLGEFNPEVLKMLENMSERKKADSAHKEKAKVEAFAPKKKIALSDNEFGKY